MNQNQQYNQPNQINYNQLPGCDFATLEAMKARFDSAVNEAMAANSDAGYDNRAQEDQDQDAIARTRIIFNKYPDIFTNVKEVGTNQQIRASYTNTIWSLNSKVNTSKDSFKRYLQSLHFNIEDGLRLPTESILVSPVHESANNWLIFPREWETYIGKRHNSTMTVYIYYRDGSIKKALFGAETSILTDQVIATPDLGKLLANSVGINIVEGTDGYASIYDPSLYFIG